MIFSATFKTPKQISETQRRKTQHRTQLANSNYFGHLQPFVSQPVVHETTNCYQAIKSPLGCWLLHGHLVNIRAKPSKSHGLHANTDPQLKTPNNSDSTSDLELNLRPVVLNKVIS